MTQGNVALMRPAQQTQTLAPAGESDVYKLGEVLARSGYFADVKEMAQAVVKVLAGRELGIGDIAAMTGIYIVKGRVTLSANLMAALVKRSGRYNYRVLTMDDAACEIEFYEDGKSCGKSSFTAEDARRSQLGGDNWKKFPRNMLFARAMSNGVKWFCPDVSTAPIYTPDELGAAVDGESGEAIPEAETAAEVAPASASAPPSEADEAAAAREAVERDKRAQGLVARGLVTRHGDTFKVNNGSVRQPETFEVWRDEAGKVRCNCGDFEQHVETNSAFRCVHILAVKFLLLRKPAETQGAEARAALVSKLEAMFAERGYSSTDTADYLKKNCGGKALEEMSLEELTAACDAEELS